MKENRQDAAREMRDLLRTKGALWNRAMGTLLFLLLAGPAGATEVMIQRSAMRPPLFEAVALGTSGGLDEADLTAFLLRRASGSGYVLLDAGTVRVGIERALKRGSIALGPARPPDATPAQRVWSQSVRAILLTHPHLDHVAGLLINSTDDKKKPIFGLSSTIDGLRDSLFNWVAWPNFGSEGEKPLGQYGYHRMTMGERVPLRDTALLATAFPLSHGGMTSTAFLIEEETGAVVFLGDTGPDKVEGGEHLALLWERLAPLVKNRRLRAIFIEVSYPNDRPDKLLFGHLTPRWLLEELGRLARVVSPKRPGKALKEVRVVITHVKPSTRAGGDARRQIARELEEGNTLGLHFVHPSPGERLRF